MDKPLSLRLYLVRHGVVEKKSGHLPDYDANLIAEQPALSALPSYLPEDALWYVSPLRRTHQTFNIIAPKQTKFKIDNRLEEQNFGIWHGQKVSSVWQEISTMSKPSHPTSFVNPETRPPEGTSFEDIFETVAPLLSDLIALRPSKPVIMISHSGTIRAILGHMMRLNAAQSLMLNVETGSVSCAEYIYGADKTNLPTNTTRWQIQYINRLYSKTDL